MSGIENKPRCLILSCSQSKSAITKPVPAIKRYTGPNYKVLAKFLREQPEKAEHLDVYILSASYGLIQDDKLIPDYDQKMTSRIAHELREQVLETFQQEILSINYEEIFLSMGQTYLLALDGIADLLDPSTKLIISRSSAGKKLTELRNWLWQDKPAKAKKSIPLVNPHLNKQTVILRGNSVSLTTLEAINIVLDGITTANGKAHRIQSWYVDIDGERISPKWAAQVLFNLPVKAFSADEARRVLRRLGLNCYQI